MQAAKRGFKLLATAVLSLALLGAGAWFAIQRHGNLHAVEVGVFYRSAQLNSHELQRVLSDQKIKTVLNLRGPNAGKGWYDEELRTVRAAGVAHIDVPMSAYQDLSYRQMQDLVQVIQRAPKPLLVHCESGADRSGLAAALFRVSQGQGLPRAQQELSVRYGHFPWLVPRSAAMDRNLARFASERALVAANRSEP